MGGEETVGALSEQQTVTLVTKNNQVFRKNISINLDEFSQLTRPLDQAFQDVVSRALDKMQIKEDTVGRIILLGGGALQPGILEGIKSRFGKDKVIFPEHPEEVVVRGIGLAFTGSLPEHAGMDNKRKQRKKTEWRLVHENGNIVDIKQEIMIAGRSKESDIVLESSKCSRTHALIRLEANALTLIDLRSKNGTFINNSQVPPSSPQQLEDGDKIRFGDQKFTVE